MATWAKIKFFYETMLGSTGSTLTASGTATGDYSESYLYNMLETNMWKAGPAAYPSCWIEYDAGAGNTKTADYLAILGHNLYTLGVSARLQWHNGTTYVDAVSAFVPSSDSGVILKEFTSASSRYWRLWLGNIVYGFPPYMTLCIWGNKTELDYASASFDPYEQEAKANVNLSQGGYVTGVHTQYNERALSLRFDDADAALYAKVKTWWDTSGLKNFFVAWDTANNPNDVYLMRPDAKFSNPFVTGGLYRTISINLKGRKE